MGPSNCARIVRRPRRRHHRSIVPVRLRSGGRTPDKCPGDAVARQKAPPPAHPLRQGLGRHAPGMGGGGRGTGRRQGGELALAPRVRMGKPDLEALAPVLLGALPLRALRRARLRHERVGRGRARRRALDRRLRARDRRGVSDGADDVARHLAGIGRLHRLRLASPRARGAAHPVRRLCARRVPARVDGVAGDVSRDGRPRARGLGQRQRGVPPGVHVALHSGRHARAARLVQRHSA